MHSYTAILPNSIVESTLMLFHTNWDSCFQDLFQNGIVSLSFDEEYSLCNRSCSSKIVADI